MYMNLCNFLRFNVQIEFHTTYMYLPKSTIMAISNIVQGLCEPFYCVDQKDKQVFNKNLICLDFSVRQVDLLVFTCILWI